MLEKERWKQFEEWTAPYVGTDGLHLLLSEAFSIYQEEVHVHKKLYHRFAEDFINSHLYHDAADAKSKNAHSKNIGILKSLLFNHKKLVSTYFSSTLPTTKIIEKILYEMDYGSTCECPDVSNKVGNQNIKATDFESILSDEALLIACTCFNTCKMFEQQVNFEYVKQFFDCTVIKPLKSKNNRLLLLFFERLSNKHYITFYWKKVMEMNRLMIRPNGGYLKATDMYSSLTQGKSCRPNSIAKKVMAYLDEIQRVMGD